MADKGLIIGLTIGGGLGLGLIVILAVLYKLRKPKINYDISEKGDITIKTYTYGKYQVVIYILKDTVLVNLNRKTNGEYETIMPSDITSDNSVRIERDANNIEYIEITTVKDGIIKVYPDKYYIDDTEFI